MALIQLNEFQPSGPRDPKFYFPDAYWDSRSGTGRWHFTVESGYPYALYMHKDRFDEFREGHKCGALRVDIRRFVERHLEGDVILVYRDKSYSYLPKPNKYDAYPERRHVNHGYWQFNFETEADLLHFKMRFGEHLDEVNDRHPDYTWVDEETVTKW